MAKSTITSKGQITIPREIRQRFGLEAGDVLDFVEEGGRIVLKRRAEEGALGILRRYAPERPVTVETMQQILRRRAAARARRR